MERTDIHRPSAIVPEDYVYVGQEYMRVDDFGGCLIMQGERERIQNHMANTGGTYSHHSHGGTCHVCGNANAMYTHLFYHAKTNTHIRTGEDCAEKMHMAVDCDRSNAFHAAIRDAIELRAGKRKAAAVLGEHNLSRAWAIYVDTAERDRNTAIIADMVGKLVKYGSLSDKQYAFLARLIDAVDHSAEVEARRLAERAAAAPIPVVDGRVDIEGVVVAIKPPEEWARFPQFKITVKADAGWVVWGSLPTSMSACTRGDRVRLSTTIKVSDRDPKFGFFSRPTKAVIVERIAQAA